MAALNQKDLLQIARELRAASLNNIKIADRLEALLGCGGPQPSAKKKSTKAVIDGVLAKRNETIARRAARLAHK